MRSAPIIITIDGPAASGKTTVSRLLAERHGWSWVSTGAFYRGLAYVALQKKISLEDEQALVKLCSSKDWEVRMAKDKTQVFLNGKEITEEINREDNGSSASFVSRFPKVRESLLDAQRRCATNVQGLVAEGRDCGTIVFPKANAKIFITAESGSRAERRAKEQGRGIEEMRLAQVIRDMQDSSRQTAPMQAPKDALVLDTSTLELDEVVQLIDQYVTKALEGRA